MVYVYCKRGSDSARALADAIGGKRLRMFDGRNFLRNGKKIKLSNGDCIIAWGDPVPEIDGVRVLNGGSVPNKYKVALKFMEKDIPTVDVRSAVPVNKTVWIGRNYNHVGGNDLLNPTPTPDFWVRRVNIVEEYRLHSFRGKCIRAGKKIVREGYSLDDAEVAASNGTIKRASDWIRSYDGGWRICYDNFQSKKAMREIAHKAVEALGLDFGAVDIGKLANGNLIVLEVNRAPGLEGNSVEQYAKHVKDWVNNESSGNEEAGVGGGESVQLGNGQVVNEGAVEPAPAAQPTAAAPNAQQPTAVAVEPVQQNPPAAVETATAADTLNHWFDTYYRNRAAQRNVVRVANNNNRYSVVVAAGNPADGQVLATAYGGNAPVQTERAVQSRQGVPPVGTGNAPNGGERSLRPFGISDVQRRRITWSRWNNKYNRIVDPTVKRQVLAEATTEARRGKLPFDPDTFPR